jgi:hypothetical protein
MADDKHYVPGDWYVIDDLRGYKVRASKARLQWDNLLTLPQSFSPRQPQDLVTGVRDEQAVPLPRPRQVNRFTVLGTSVVAPAARGSTSIQVASSVGFNPGDQVQVMLDSGVNFQFTLGTVSGNTLSWSGAGLPDTVGTLYGDPIENSVIDITSIGGT